MNNPRLLVLGVLVLWSFGTLLGRLIADRAPFFLLGISFLGSAAVFLPYYLREVRRSGAGGGLRADWQTVLVSITGYFVYSTCLCLSFRAYGRAAEPTVLNYTWPLFTVLFSGGLALGSRRGRVELLGLVLGFGGVFLLATDGHPFHSDLLQPAGVVWGLLAGVSYGFYSARSGLVPADRHAAFLLLGTLGSLVCILPLAWGDLAQLSALTARELVFALALGVIVNGLGYGLWTRANRLAREQGVPAAQLAAPTFFLPLSALVLIYLLLGEGRVFSPGVLGSTLLVLAGSIFCRRPDLFIAVVDRSGTRTRIVDKSR